MRKTRISVNEYYHIYNRGNDKQKIFLDERDWARFLFLILYFQSPSTSFLNNLGRPVSYFVKHSVFNISKKSINEIVKTRYVELVSFTNMTNHFHLIIREIKEGGISRYMQRVLNAYTKYFNTKYKRSGHLFQGPYQAVHIENDMQLTYLSAYIHRNPREIKKWKNKEHNYTWSSFQDYTKKNRWGKLLKHEIITEQIGTGKNYKSFVNTGTAKLTLDEELMLD